MSRLDDPDAVREKIAVLDRAIEIDPLNHELRRHRERLLTVIECLEFSRALDVAGRRGGLLLNAAGRRN